MTGNDAVTGSCLCGSVTLEITKLDRDVIVCHCRQCRKQTGHVVAATRAADENLVVHGADNLDWYAASEDAKRGFCKQCGSLLFWKENGSNATSVMAGCLESPTGLQVAAHIFTADKGDYYDIPDGVPQFSQSD